MTLMAPVWLGVGGIAAAMVVTIHLIAWRLPKVASLPTARFIPRDSASRMTRAIMPSDFALLALRAGIVLLAGLAMARPRIATPRSGSVRVVLADHSLSVADPAEVEDTVRSLVAGRPGSRLVVFDTGAQAYDADGAAQGRLARAGTAPPSLSAGLVAAIREALALRRTHDTVDLIVVSPFDGSAFDAATSAVRSLWPDSIALVRVRLAVGTPSKAPVDVRSAGDDPVAAGIRLAAAHGLVHGDVRVVRGTPDAEDRGWMTGGNRLLVQWAPVDVGDALASGVHARDATVIGYLFHGNTLPDGTPAAWWLDGAPAAVTVPAGSGCERVIGFDVPDEGDLVLTPSFQRLVGALLEPCGAGLPGAPVHDSVLSALAAGRERRIVAAATPRPLTGVVSAVLFAAALGLSLVEFVVRRRVTVAVPAPAGGALR